ncbi:hypothetical protein EYF80_009786 [Liparis tanakae]|uniref:Uncharacterized protein n=1 Tax=Liparis tanakae TaxID=230148 RepID=A0A4Z2IPM5_9TELE|nr:hypothetical protein EYF80_009786 [Liparis tanakae]
MVAEDAPVELNQSLSWQVSERGSRPVQQSLIQLDCSPAHTAVWTQSGNEESILDFAGIG